MSLEDCVQVQQLRDVNGTLIDVVVAEVVIVVMLAV